MPPARILIVEDDVAIRRLVTMVLERQGHEVEFASDGLEAASKLAQHDYDVIVLDMMMPNLDGFTFIENLAKVSPERLSRVIVTSAASPGVLRERLKVSPFSVLPKPFDIHELASRVRACLDARAAG